MTDTELKCKILGVITVSLPNSDLRQSLILTLIREYKADLVCRLMGERAIVAGKELNRDQAYEHFRLLSPQDLESLISDCASSGYMKGNWLYNEKGEVRPELHTLTKHELDEKQAEIIDRPAAEWATFPDAVRALESGDTIYIKPEYSVAKEFGGRMTFIQLSGNSMFCRTENGGGGFIGVEMLVDTNDPTLR